MDYISNREEQCRQMLEALNLKSVDELFAAVPQALRRPRPSGDDGLSEYEALRWLEELASHNQFSEYENYLGGGAYEHHCPAIVGAICAKSEFLTSYTPYQAEVSQGLLQAIFEYQSAICALTGLDVANASVYDGAAACAEAVLMGLRLQPSRTKVVIAGSVHPHYQAAVAQYLRSHAVKPVVLPYQPDGTTPLEALREALDDKCAVLLLQSPNFFGCVEPVKELFASARSVGALTVLCANPLAYGLFPSAGDLGADIAVGDTQPFGLPLQFGGPYAGYMATRKDFLRQLPGRLVGQTVDLNGRSGFVLTLQAREQHIRREKATSNICTNQALAALAGLVTILWYGPEGLRRLALTNYQRACYLREGLGKIAGIHLMTSGMIFNEFVVTYDRPLRAILKTFRKAGIDPGIVLDRYGKNLKQSLLVAVTETKSKAQLDHYLQVAREAVHG